METLCVRFDDLSPGGAGSFALTGKVDTFVAKRPDEVVPVLEAAEAASRAGYWVAGFVAYEAAPGLNPVLTVRPPGLHDPMRDLPLARFEAFSSRVDLGDLSDLKTPPAAYSVSGWTPDSSRKDYRESLAVTGRAIMAGEIERGKHTFRLHAAFSGDPFSLYRDLLLSQRGPHGACIDTGRFHLVSVSPESFFKVEDNVLTVRPVLDSIRRGRWQAEDSDLSAMLAARGELSYASHVLLAAAEAELSKLGVPLDIDESPIVSLDRLELLWHLTARIGVRIADDVTLHKIFETLFPPLSVTGVPRQESMDVIAQTEDTPRGAYCGAIGLLSPRGSSGVTMSFSVAVRTVVLDLEEGVAEYGVGTAITNASSVVGAYEEARLKAKVLVDRRPEFHLVEQFRIVDGEADRLEAKLDVLAESARYFGYEVSRDLMVIRVKNEAVDIGNGALDLLVGRDGSIETSRHEPVRFCESAEEAIHVSGAIAADRMSRGNVFLFHKTTDTRFAEVLQRQAPETGPLVLVNEDGSVARAHDGNIVARIDGRWVTPPRSCGNALYVFHRELVDAGVIRVAPLTLEQLIACDVVAVVNDLNGWRIVDI